MATETTPRLMTKTEYARHRGVSKPYITKLAKNGVLVLRGGKVDVHASDTVLDDKPVDDVDPPPAQASPAGPPPRPAAESLGQAGASFGQARTIEMVFRAKLRRLEFETKQGRLIEAEAVRKTIAEAVRTLRDGILGLAGSSGDGPGGRKRFEEGPRHAEDRTLARTGGAGQCHWRRLTTRPARR